MITTAYATINSCNQHRFILKGKIAQSISFDHSNRTLGLQSALTELENNCPAGKIISDIETTLAHLQQEMEQKQESLTLTETELSFELQKEGNNIEQLASKLEKDKMTLLDLQDKIEIFEAKLEGLRLQPTD